MVELVLSTVESLWHCPKQKDQFRREPPLYGQFLDADLPSYGWMVRAFVLGRLVNGVSLLIFDMWHDSISMAFLIYQRHAQLGRLSRAALSIILQILQSHSLA